MIESYAVGARFTLVDEFTPKLLGMFEELGKFDTKITGLNETLSKFGFGFGQELLESFAKVGKGFTEVEERAAATGGKITADFEKVGGGISQSFLAGFSKIDQGFGDIASKATSIGTEFTTEFAKIGSGIGTAVTEGVATAMREIERLQQKIAEAVRFPAIGGGGSGGGGGHTRRPGEGGGHGNSYGQHGVGVDAGIFGFMGYETVKSGVEATLEHGMELAHVQQQMRQANMSQSEIDSATKGAWTEANRYGLDVSKVLEDIKELRFPFGSTEHAINFIDPLEKMRVVLNSVMPGSGHGAADAVYEMARAGELKGLQKPEEFLQYFDDMTKVISATGGKVTPKDFMQAMKYGRVASLGWDEEFTTKYLPTLMQSLGPSGGGTAAMSLFGTLAQGKVGKRSLEQMEDIGLIGDWSKIIYDKQGNPAGFNPGAIKDTDEFVKNPALWAQHTLLPLLTAKFGDLSDDTNRLHIAEGLGGMFGNRMSAQSIAEFILRMQSINKDAALTGEARGIGGAEDLLKHDPTAVMNNFRAAWSNLLSAFGQSSVQPAIEMMNGLAGGINRFGQFAQTHPEVTKQIEGALGGLAAGLGALAVVGLAVFLPTGTATLAITTLGGTLTGLVAVNWGDLKTKVAEGIDFLKTLPDAIGKFVDDLIAKGNAIFGPLFHGDPSLRPMTQEEKAWRLWHQGQEPPAGLFGGVVQDHKALRDLPHSGREEFGPPMPPNYTPPGAGLGMEPSQGSSGFIPMAFITGGSEGSGLEDMIYRGTLRAFTDFANGVGLGGVGGSGAGGLIKASYDGGGFGGSGEGYAFHGVPNLRYGHPHGDGSLVDDPIAKFAAGGAFDAKAPEIMRRLMGDFGIDKFEAAKVLGNLGHESMGFRAFDEIGGGGGIGWAQWTGPRHREFMAWSAANHLDPHSDEANYGFLKHELAGKYARGIAYLKAGGSLEGFEGIFEGAGVKAYGSRHAYEERALRDFDAAPNTASSRPSFIPPPRQPKQTPQIIQLHADGKILAEVVTHHQAHATKLEIGPHYHDDSAHYASPDTVLG